MILMMAREHTEKSAVIREPFICLQMFGQNWEEVCQKENPLCSLAVWQNSQYDYFRAVVTALK